MKLGQKYSFKDENGNEREVLWMESVLDMKRYFTHNVFCPYSGFSLVKESELTDIWDRLDTVIHEKINKVCYIDGRNPIEKSELIYISSGAFKKGLEIFSDYLDSKMPQEVIDEIDGGQNSYLPAQFQYVRLIDGTILQDTD